MKAEEVIQPGRGKGAGNTSYIRVTNIRAIRTDAIQPDEELFDDYVDIVVNRLRVGKKAPRSLEIQRTPNLGIYELNKDGNDYSVADFDDGMIHIGTKFCFNTENPKCTECPMNDICKGYLEAKDLITDYRT